jgi:hypothetical protein
MLVKGARRLATTLFRVGPSVAFVAPLGKAAMSQSEQDYLLARAEKERALAAEASDELVRGIHLDLAHAYEVRANVREVATRADNDALGLTSGGGRSS